MSSAELCNLQLFNVACFLFVMSNEKTNQKGKLVSWQCVRGQFEQVYLCLKNVHTCTNFSVKLC